MVVYLLLNFIFLAHSRVPLGTVELTIGVVYKMAITIKDARDKFANPHRGSTGGCDGVYDFIAARKWIWFFNNDFVQDKVVFRRQYYDTNFLGVFVLNPHIEENTYCLGQRPEYIIPLLHHTTTFTDASHWWRFLALPEDRY